MNQKLIITTFRLCYLPNYMNETHVTLMLILYNSILSNKCNQLKINLEANKIKMTNWENVHSKYEKQRVKSSDTKYSLINMKNTSTLEKEIDNSYQLCVHVCCV